MKNRVTAFTNTELVDQLCDAVISKLAERVPGFLPSKQWVESSSLSRDASKLRRPRKAATLFLFDTLPPLQLLPDKPGNPGLKHHTLLLGLPLGSIPQLFVYSYGFSL